MCFESMNFHEGDLFVNNYERDRKKLIKEITKLLEEVHFLELVEIKQDIKDKYVAGE